MSQDDADVRLRDVVEDDLEFLLAYEHDPEAVRRSGLTPRPRDAFLRHWKTKVLGDDTVFVQAMTVDGEVAGSVVAWWDGDRRFLGYWLGRPYWGRGIGSRALALFLERERNRPLYADPAIGNTSSVRLLEKHGFQRTGTVRRGEDEHVVFALL
ncbi:GNAT family N-acetyltransferase [Streptomyces sp. NPDC057424]|uniref:GNAT family N-acetyltransferase n=1 Tax=Streptomyces sp. NPDC057424 TaxID=3346127 RepID=UPI0036A96A36